MLKGGEKAKYARILVKNDVICERGSESNKKSSS